MIFDYLAAATNGIIVVAFEIFWVIVCFWHSLNTNYYGDNHLQWNAGIFKFPTDPCVRIGNRSVMTSVYSLFRRTRPAQNVASRGFEPNTSSMPGKRHTIRLQLPLSHFVNKNLEVNCGCIHLLNEIFHISQLCFSNSIHRKRKNTL